MNVIAGIWLYLMIGCLIGRIAFVRILADHPRRLRGNDHVLRSTYTFDRARGAALACVPFWPVAGPLALMFSHTGYEKARLRKEQLEKQIQELEEVEER